MSEPDEVRAFASAVASAAARVPVDDRWRPGSLLDVSSDAALAALAAAGWDEELGRDPGLLPFVGPAAVELGRALAPVEAVDLLLGGGLLCGQLVRSARAGGVAVEAVASGLRCVRLLELERRAYGDGEVAVVRRVEALDAIAADEAVALLYAWSSATVGYLAGVATLALELATEHARTREAFGRPLAALDAVQAHLADAATAAQGLVLLASEPPTAAALAHAGPAAVDVTAACHQVCGAMGFTLEFPLGRASRRARALGLWADAVLEAGALEAAAAGAGQPSRRSR